MHTLLIENDVCLDDEDLILKEVAQFYKELFQSIGDNIGIQEARWDFL